MSSAASKTQKNRRTTLSNLPNPNRRQSVDPNASATSIPKSTRRPPSNGRMSMIPRMGGRENTVPPPGTPSSATSAVGSTVSSRRRSIGGDSFNGNRRQSVVPPSSNGSVSQRADPRPINDKNFQQQCIKQLLVFLQQRRYEYPVSVKSLSRPSAKDFSNITTFMLRLIDHDFQRGGMKFEDEVAQSFKCMGYPFPISKTALVAAGSPHTWPALLAALTWLVHQLDCATAYEEQDYLDNTAETPFDTLQDLHTRTDKAFFQYMGRAYMAFMKGDDVATEKLERALEQRFLIDDAFVEQYVERISDLNASILERINEIALQSEDLPIYTKKREEYAIDLEQFHDLIRQMDEHKLALEGKVSERTTELAETNVKLDRMTTHINELKQAIKEQEFSVDDIHKLESELKGLSEANDRAHSIRDQMRKMLLASEEELVAVCNDLDSVTSKYNGKIAEFQLVPDLGSKFSHMKSEVRKGKLLESDQSQILGVDLVGTVQQLAFSSNEKYLEKNNKATSQCQNFLDRMISAEDAYKEEDAKFQILQDKKSKFEQTLEKERKTLEAKLAVRQREVEAMENKIASLQDPVALEEQIASYERQCAELTALRIKHEEENVARYKSVVNELNSACQLMSDHDAFFHQTAAQVKAYWKEKTDAMVDIVSPTNLGDD